MPPDTARVFTKQATMTGASISIGFTTPAQTDKSDHLTQ